MSIVNLPPSQHMQKAGSTMENDITLLIAIAHYRYFVLCLSILQSIQSPSNCIEYSFVRSGVADR